MYGIPARTLPMLLGLALSAAGAGAEPWRFEVVEGSGTPTPARVALVAADGSPVFPAGVNRYRSPVGVDYFYTDGRFELRDATPPLRVRVTRGFETPALEREVTPAAEPTRLVLERAVLMAERGWYSGDGHVHPFHRLARYPLTNADLVRQLRAEDLNLANLLAANAAGDRVYGAQRITGREEPGSPPGVVLRFSEEYRSRTFGHEAVYGVPELSDPVHTGHAGTKTPWDHPTNHDANLRYRERGAFPSCAHLRPLALHRVPAEPLDLRVPECPVDVALGSVRAIEVLGFAVLSEAAVGVWERMMNAGFDVVVTAGTDSFLGRPGQTRVGGARAYVQLDGRPFGYEAWVEQLARGRAFVTNGALLFLRVGDAEPGQSLALAAGETRRVPVHVQVWSLAPWTRVEVRRMGGPPLVFASDPAAPRQQEFRGELELAGPGWVYAHLRGPWSPAVPAGGLLVRPDLEAITNAVWVRRGDETRRDVGSVAYLEDWVRENMERLEQRDNYGSPANRRHVRGVFQQALDALRALRGDPAQP